MELQTFNRNSFKHNILKQVILRLDFQGVLPLEMEKVLVSIKSFLKEKGFTRYEQRIENEIEIPMGMLQINPAEASVPNFRNIEIHSFTDENKGYSVDLTTNFICLKVNATKYIPFDEYAAVFMGIADMYRAQIDFFSVKRFGLRKINFCFLKDLGKINKYFNEQYFNYNKLFPNTNNFVSERKETFSVDSCKVNLLYGIAQGQLESDTIYKIVLDSDIYIDVQRNIEENIFVNNGISELNDKLFSIYKNSITTVFAEMLSNEDTDFTNEILGVERNE